MRYLLSSLALVVCVAVIAGGGGAAAGSPVATAASGKTFKLQDTIGEVAPTKLKWDYDARAGTASWHHPCCEAGEWTVNYTFTPPPTLTTGGSDTFNLKIAVTQCESGSGC